LRLEFEAHRALKRDPRAFGNALRLRDEARDAWACRTNPTVSGRKPGLFRR
jgi:hypothetical protein